jgi:hypothetical protein
MDRSVGVNTHEALNCLTATSYGRSRVTCRRDYQFVNGRWSMIPRTQADYDAGRVPEYIRFMPSPTLYDRSNWKFYIFHGEWQSMVEDFVGGIHDNSISVLTHPDNQPANLCPTDFDVVSFQFSYLNVDEASTIAEFFTHRPGQFDDAYDLEREIAEHLDPLGIKFVYWTTSLARGIGTATATDLNNLMRQWAVERNRPLFDFADIEQHDMYGSPCHDNRDGEQYCWQTKCENHLSDGVDVPAVCQDKTTEIDGGHLSTAQGLIPVAKAFWILISDLMR